MCHSTEWTRKPLRARKRYTVGETSKNYSFAAHFKYLGTSIEEEVVWKRKSQSGWAQAGEIGWNAAEYCEIKGCQRQQRDKKNGLRWTKWRCYGGCAEIMKERHANCTSCQQFCRCLYLGSSRQVQAENLLCSYNANSCRVSMPVKLSVNSYAMNSWCEWAFRTNQFEWLVRIYFSCNYISRIFETILLYTFLWHSFDKLLCTHSWKLLSTQKPETGIYSIQYNQIYFNFHTCQ